MTTRELISMLLIIMITTKKFNTIKGQCKIQRECFQKTTLHTVNNNKDNKVTKSFNGTKIMTTAKKPIHYQLTHSNFNSK